MKIAAREDADLTQATTVLEINGNHSRAAVEQQVLLRRGSTYEVLAVMFSSKRAGPDFLVLSEQFADRVKDGLTYPDLIPFGNCNIVDATIPADWILRTACIDGASYSFIGSPLMVEEGFHERLTDGDELAVGRFNAFLRAANLA